MILLFITNVKYKCQVKGGKNVGHKLPMWCKRAKIRLIERDLSVGELSSKLGMARTYVSSVLNGRVYSEVAIKRISDYLEISDAYDAAGNVYIWKTGKHIDGAQNVAGTVKGHTVYNGVKQTELTRCKVG